MRKIYLASSWRNSFQQKTVMFLREAGHAVYDFRNPGPGLSGFAWSEIDPKWKQWGSRAFRRALSHPLAIRGHHQDREALRNWCDTCVLVLPCGASAHLELGVASGMGKPTIVFAPELREPELMYRECDEPFIVLSTTELLAWLDQLDK